MTMYAVGVATNCDTKAFGLWTYHHAEIAVYHALGELPEPRWLAH